VRGIRYPQLLATRASANFNLIHHLPNACINARNASAKAFIYYCDVLLEEPNGHWIVFVHVILNVLLQLLMTHCWWDLYITGNSRHRVKRSSSQSHDSSTSHLRAHTRWAQERDIQLCVCQTIACMLVKRNINLKNSIPHLACCAFSLVLSIARSLCHSVANPLFLALSRLCAPPLDTHTHILAHSPDLCKKSSSDGRGAGATQTNSRLVCCGADRPP